MKFLDVYPHCQGCPVSKYCGTMVGSIRLCNSYKTKEEKEKELADEVFEEEIKNIVLPPIDLFIDYYVEYEPEDEYIPERDNIIDLSDGDLYRGL